MVHRVLKHQHIPNAIGVGLRYFWYALIPTRYVINYSNFQVRKLDGVARCLTAALC